MVDEYAEPDAAVPDAGPPDAEVKQVASKKRRKRRKASGTATKSGEGDKKGGKKKLNIKLGGDGITF